MFTKKDTAQGCAIPAGGRLCGDGTFGTGPDVEDDPGLQVAAGVPAATNPRNDLGCPTLGESESIHPRPACETLSRRYADILTANGIPAKVVEGNDPDYSYEGMVGYHQRVVVGETQVDWTVRQFYNLSPG